ncbi:MAG TPA: hypothetical protein VNW47_11470 [Terriglobales bacterium]|jgi:hypothetical protein|nr:hypothetical protein [Terriglobales bacterium]
MKTLGTFHFITLAMPSSVIAQSQTTPLSDSNRAIIQSWSAANHSGEARIEGDRLILPSDDRDSTCAFMRVYRMKRDVPGSDVTRPAGYTTCVNAARFTMRSSAKPQVLREPTDK